MDFKSTLNLPDPEATIPMKAGLSEREPEMLKRWDEMGLYHRRMMERAGAEDYVLHDGPPYTNSPMHIGTAFNNILKDFVLKSRFLMGYRTPYVPGYDNHGLPIEQAVMKKFVAQKVTPTIAQLRQACRDHAAEYIQIQNDQRQRLGMMGLFEKPYTTMDFRFEAGIIRVFKRLVEAGQIYRGLRPVLWSPTSRTALADTEIVYKEHTSKSIYVRFPLKHDANGWSKQFDGPIFCVIWTTTPWTIPANLAVAFHPGLDYSVVRVDGNYYVMLSALVEKVAEKIGWGEYEVVGEFLGATFEHTTFAHPVYGRDSLAVLADYVTTEDGTGVVHTAPGHGRDDFYTGLRYGLEVLCPVNDRGVLTEEAGEFAGTYYKECDKVVVDRLEQLGHLLKAEPYVHQYPHAERDEQPVIYRATDQWFVSMDANDLRHRMLGEIERTSWIPANGQARITHMITTRPDWCISRQRPWGVGIPVLFGADSGQPVLDPDVIERIAQRVEEEGSDIWFSKPASYFLPEGFKHPSTGETEFRLETDVFDVWFDSGSTWSVVLEGDTYSQWKAPLPADLYLEGSDQHRGWFNVSLILSTALRGEAPYRQVVTHGYLTDSAGNKQSKRSGNAADPSVVCSTYGADILRYWCSSVNFSDDAPYGDDLLKVASEGYRKIRNTFRFLLGNLSGFSESDSTEATEPIDRWIIEQTELLCSDVVRKYEAMDFRDALNTISIFCSDEVSSLYIDAIKDRMYCDLAEWPSRKSAQRACFEVLKRLCILIAPIIPFTAEEVYQRLPLANKKDSVHLETFVSPDNERLEAIEGNTLQAQFASILSTRKAVFVALEQWRNENQVKNSQDVLAHLRVPAGEFSALIALEGNELANLFKMSWIHLSEGEWDVRFEPSPYAECERSRLRRPDVREANGHMLSARDIRALGW